MPDISLSPTHKTGRMAFARPLGTWCWRWESGEIPWEESVGSCPPFSPSLLPSSRVCKPTVCTLHCVQVRQCGQVPSSGITARVSAPGPDLQPVGAPPPLSSLHCWQHCCTGRPASTVQTAMPWGSRAIACREQGPPWTSQTSRGRPPSWIAGLWLSREKQPLCSLLSIPLYC